MTLYVYIYNPPHTHLILILPNMFEGVWIFTTVSRKVEYSRVAGWSSHLPVWSFWLASPGRNISHERHELRSPWILALEICDFISFQFLSRKTKTELQIKSLPCAWQQEASFFYRIYQSHPVCLCAVLWWAELVSPRHGGINTSWHLQCYWLLIWWGVSFRYD